MPPSYSFLRNGKWILGHVIVLIAIAGFVNLGFWQLRRLADRQEFNDRLSSRTAAVPQPLAAVLNQYGPDQEDLELRRVEAIGEYRPADEVVLLARSFNGLSGHHVLTPLALRDGTVVIIDRGWVPIDMDEPGDSRAAPPPGPVTVVGILRKTEIKGSFGPTDPADGELQRIARVDLARLDQQIDEPVLPVYVQLQSQVPPQPSALPQLVALPTPSEGSHRGYAVQWFLFAGVVAVGYPVLLRRTAETKGEAVANHRLGRSD